MSLPIMDADPTAPARRPPVHTVDVTPTTTVRIARRVLAATGKTATVVTHHGRPVGVVTSDALDETDGSPPGPDTPVGKVMDYELVRITPKASEIETLHAYQDAAWESLRRRHPCA